MAHEVPVKDWPVFAVKLHPQLVAFLEDRAQRSGRSIEAEVVETVGAAMEAVDVMLAPANTRFACSEELMAQKAECNDCGEVIRRNAKVWAERHVQQTGHNVQVSLYLDMRDECWLDKLSGERRAELDEFRDDPEKARALAGSLLQGLKGQKPS